MCSCFWSVCHEVSEIAYTDRHMPTEMSPSIDVAGFGSQIVPLQEGWCLSIGSTSSWGWWLCGLCQIELLLECGQGASGPAQVSFASFIRSEATIFLYWKLMKVWFFFVFFSLLEPINSTLCTSAQWSSWCWQCCLHVCWLCALPWWHFGLQNFPKAASKKILQFRMINPFDSGFGCSSPVLLPPCSSLSRKDLIKSQHTSINVQAWQLP